ncbi:MAG: VWA domain-containing protein [Pyrinomonadaceae bacterium]
MKNFTLLFLCLGMLGISTFAQANRSTRPRVAATPAPPVIQNETRTTERTNRPPVLQGGTNRPAPTPTPEADDENEVIKVETNLVTMPVSILDREGRFISGLQQKDFKIFENGIEQKVDYFQSVEQPFTVVLMIDVSPSTAYQINEIHEAAISFVNQLRSNDKVMVIAFDDTVRVLSQPTSNRGQLRNAIYQAQFGDGTSLYEAVDYVLNQELRRIPGRKAVVLFTDGVDTTSRRANYQSTVTDVEEADALFYPIKYNTQRDGFGSGGGGGYGYPQPRNRQRRGSLEDILGTILGGGGSIQIGRGGRGGAAGTSSEYETAQRYLEALAQNSGGRNFDADVLSNLEASFAGIAEELRRQYSLGYYPENPGRIGERKQIKVRVLRPNVVVRAKNSYIVGEKDRKLAGK